MEKYGLGLELEPTLWENGKRQCKNLKMKVVRYVNAQYTILRQNQNSMNGLKTTIEPKI